MFLKMTKGVQVSAWLGILCVLLLAGGIYLYHQHTGEPVQERIYGVPERSARQTAPTPTAFQRAPVHSTPHPHAAEEPHHGDIDTAHNHDRIHPPRPRLRISF